METPRRVAPQRVSAFFSWAVIAFVLIGLFPLTVNAGAVVIFFSGLCVGGTRQVTCSAGRNAYNAIKPLLPAGADVYSPTLNNGKFTNNGEQEAVLKAIRSNKAVLVAFSAGHQALWQTVSALSSEDLKRVHSIVNLEANYGGWYSSVSHVRRHNPATGVHSFTSGQCGTSHDQMPGNSCIAGKIAALAKQAHDGTPASVPQEPPPPPATPVATAYTGQTGSPSGSPTGSPTGSTYTPPSQPYSGYTPVSTGYSTPLAQPYQSPNLNQSPLESGSYVPLSNTSPDAKKLSDELSFLSLTTMQATKLTSHATSSSAATTSGQPPGKSEATSPPKTKTTFEALPGGGIYYFPEPPRPTFDIAAALANIIKQVQALLAALFTVSAPAQGEKGQF